MNFKWTSIAVVLVMAFGAVLIFSQQRPESPQEPRISDAPVKVTIYKSPYCGCCGEYEKYLARKGFSVETITTEDLATMKQELEIPIEMQSCHTAKIGRYFVEGHVPVEAIDHLLEQNPAIDGIALPGMPAGSPGMGGVKSAPFQIYALSHRDAEIFLTL